MRAAETMTYILAPGSTITVYLNGVTIGPEPLTGSFEWLTCGYTEDRACFDTTRLDFQSATFSIQLRGPNELVSGLLYTGAPLFAEAVDAAAIMPGPVELTSVYREGKYTEYPEGIYLEPTPYPLSLEYPDLRLRPLGADGPYLAGLDIKAVADRDQDGVLDDRDHCPNTPAGAIADGDGCSIDQLVPCAGPAVGETWKNHGQYVSAVSRTAQAFFEANRITRKQREAIAYEAERSDCGKR